MTVGGRHADQVMLRERFGLDNLAEVRGLVRRAILAAGLHADLAGQLTMATAEGMANAIVHGGGFRVVTISVVPEVGVIAEVYDDGQATAFAPPSEVPPPDREGGRGLLLACALCNRVSITTGRAGTVLTLQMDYRRAP